MVHFGFDFRIFSQKRGNDDNLDFDALRKTLPKMLGARDFSKAENLENTTF